MANQDIELMAHLMRRAGFGATYEEVERRAAAATRPPSMNSSPRWNSRTWTSPFSSATSLTGRK